MSGSSDNNNFLFGSLTLAFADTRKGVPQELVNTCADSATHEQKERLEKYVKKISGPSGF